MQFYSKKGKKVIKRRFRAKHFPNRADYQELFNVRGSVKRKVRPLKEAWKRQQEKEKEEGGEG